MIANQPAKFCISLIHLSIALFCFSFCIGFTLADKEGSFLALIKSNDFFAVLVCFCVGGIALTTFVFLQTEQNVLGKKLTFLLSFALLIQYLAAVFAQTENRKMAILALALFLFPPIVFVFLLALSKVGKEEKLSDLETDDILDIDFSKSVETSSNSTYFFKIHRIVALFLAVGGTMTLINNIFNKLPDLFIPIYIVFL